ncbi:hypothetical protein ACFYXF_34730 [Streptomyces sp. NPDC002680]
MESKDGNEARADEVTDVEFEDSSFGKWLAARSADGIRGAVGC